LSVRVCLRGRLQGDAAFAARMQVVRAAGHKQKCLCHLSKWGVFAERIRNGVGCVAHSQEWLCYLKAAVILA
jgi:hypothetical protein